MISYRAWPNGRRGGFGGRFGSGSSAAREPDPTSEVSSGKARAGHAPLPPATRAASASATPNRPLFAEQAPHAQLPECFALPTRPAADAINAPLACARDDARDATELLLAPALAGAPRFITGPAILNA